MGILISRPDEAGLTLSAQLNAAGVTAVHFPFFTITAGTQLNSLPNVFNRLKTGDYVVAVSKNAVAYAAQTLKAVGSHWRKDLQYFTVGQGSAAALSAISGQPVNYPNRRQNSEGLLALEAMQQAQAENKNILILRGNGGRELFPQTMQHRGATVEMIECYQRLPIIYQDNAEQVNLWQRAGINQILITNAESLTYLMDFVPQSEHNWLIHCQLTTISERIADLAREHGWQQIVIVPKADNESLLQTILANQSI